MITSWHSYPKIYNLGHAAVRDIFNGPCVIEEKVDGSQFSFGVFDGELRVRSKGQQLVVGAPEKMFIEGVKAVDSIKHMLMDGWTYRGEYLKSPKHNTLKYNRIPTNHVIIFDINPAEEQYLGPLDKLEECQRIGMECVPLLGCSISTMEEIQVMMDRESILGGAKIEGLVIKRYDLFGPDKKVVMAKHVSEAFKEKHGTEWKKSNPSKSDIVQMMIETYKTEPRWRKAVQHLAESGDLEDSPRDIPKLMKEVSQDILAEYENEIKQALFKWAWPKISRGVTGGLPEWYKDMLMKKQFGNEGEQE